MIWKCSGRASLLVIHKTLLYVCGKVDNYLLARYFS